MCSIPSQRTLHDSSEVALFVRVLQEVFGDERWEEVEPSARRAWIQIASITGIEWEQVCESVQRSWQLQ
jgi:hypothetical protein